MAELIPIQHFIQIRDGSPEWEYMWAQIPDRDYVSPSGEGWQYMGTVLLETGVWVHQFRHRQHPSGKGLNHHVDVHVSSKAFADDLSRLLQKGLDSSEPRPDDAVSPADSSSWHAVAQTALLHQMRLAYHLSRLATSHFWDTEERAKACKAAYELPPHIPLTEEEAAHGRLYLTSEEVCLLLRVSRFRVRQFRLAGLLKAEQENQRVFKFQPGPAWELYLKRKEKGPDLHKGGRPKKETA